MAEHTFDDGSLYLIDTVRLDHSDTVKVGHEHTGTITGGTGRYHGIRGSYHLKVVATDAGYRSVMTYSLLP